MNISEKICDAWNTLKNEDKEETSMTITCKYSFFYAKPVLSSVVKLRNFLLLALYSLYDLLSLTELTIII